MEFRNPEEELVVLCAQTPLMDPTKAQIQTLLEQPINWSACHEYAQSQHVTPLFFHTLFTYWKRTPPAPFIDELRQWYQKHSIRNLMVTAEMLKFKQFGLELDVPLLVVRGPVLARLTYGDVRLRQFANLDLFVHAEDVDRMRDLLLENNYDAITPAPPAEPRTDCAVFAHRSRLFNVELHWQLWPPHYDARVTLDGAWDRLQSVAFTERESMSTLAGGDLLLYLCGHGAVHDWSRLSYLCDVNQLLLSRVSFDWPGVAKQISRAQDGRSLLLGLALVRTVFGTTLPAEIASMCDRDGQLNKRLTEAWEHMRERTNQPGTARSIHSN